MVARHYCMHTHTHLLSCLVLLAKHGVMHNLQALKLCCLVLTWTDGSPTRTCWNRLSKAASFSMCCLCSARVVAPMHLSSPRASMGFSRLAATRKLCCQLRYTDMGELGSHMICMYFMHELIFTGQTCTRIALAAMHIVVSKWLTCIHGTI